MSKEFIIFVWPQLDDDSNGQASLVVRVGHSIPYALWYRTEASQVAALASIILIEEGPKAEASIAATGTTSAYSSALPRPKREDIGTVHRTTLQHVNSALRLGCARLTNGTLIRLRP
jgi:hypothetical protein